MKIMWDTIQAKARVREHSAVERSLIAHLLNRALLCRADDESVGGVPPFPTQAHDQDTLTTAACRRGSRRATRGPDLR